MAKSFAEQVGAFVAQSEGRMTTVFRESMQNAINEAQRERGKGGNMPVDTGFLRATGDAAFTGDSLPEADNGVYKWSPTASLIIINQAKLGDIVYFGWLANYAQFMERRYGFARLASQNWDQIVQRAAQALEGKFSR